MGQPFVGYSGQMLDRWMREAEPPITRAAVWVDNVVRCWLPGNREPRGAEIQHCLQAHVRPALRALGNLKVLVPVGMVATRAFLSKEATDGAVGAVIRRELDA